MTKQERKSMLYDEFDKFTYEPGESIHSYYLRYAELINDIKIIPMSMSNMQIKMKFVNHLQREWSRFVTVAKQAIDLYSVNFDQLYAFLKHNEKDAKEVREMRQRFPEPLTLLANTYNPPPSYNSYAGNAGKNQASGARVVNTVGNARENKPRVIKCYNCNGEGHIAKQSTTKKRVKDSERFKDKMILAQAQEVGVVLNDKQQDFLADSLEKTDDCDDLQLQATINFKADHVDAYDSDCDYAGNLHMFTAYPIPWLRCKPFLKTKNKFETFSKNYVQENELCGCVPWKPSRDFTRPLGTPHGLKGLLHMLNATVIPTKKVHIFYTGLDIPTRRVLDSKGFIPLMTPTQALISIQVMAEHSHNWYDEATTREKINDSPNNVDTMKPKEDIHVIQASFKKYEGEHLTMEYPLEKEDKAVEQSKYMRSLEETS
ncbi:retrovirus-related pol polyprotein from transposon TNT 1-94 [Tanacetum coccineum]|uniref:Retrovirus-related pol polyprotein from transposon TNT 1-94 n=1 Tax=Tanacetum coccineum TaxID=301880 RepID=A0ABQ5EA21_9ASTR